MQDFSVEFGNQPFDHSAGGRFFQPRYLTARDTRIATLQLDQPNVQQITVRFPEPESYGVNNTSSWSASLTFEERHAPSMLVAVIAERFFTCGFRDPDFSERTQPLSSHYGFCGSRPDLSRTCSFLTSGQFIEHDQSISPSGAKLSPR